MTRNTPLKTAVLTATLGTLAILAAPSASAQEIKFAYRQHELQTPDGTRNVYQRLMHKVRATCGSWATITVAHSLARRACVADLSSQLVRKIGDARIAAMHDTTYARTRFASRK